MLREEFTLSDMEIAEILREEVQEELDCSLEIVRNFDLGRLRIIETRYNERDRNKVEYHSYMCNPYTGDINLCIEEVIDTLIYCLSDQGRLLAQGHLVQEVRKKHLQHKVRITGEIFHPGQISYVTSRLESGQIIRTRIYPMLNLITTKVFD